MDTPLDLIVPTRLVDPVDLGDIDLYLPGGPPRHPVVLLVHGLFQEPPPQAPRRTGFFAGYASQLARRGVAAAVFDHELTGGMRYPEAAATLDRVLRTVRERQEVDADRVAVWFFSGGGPLAYPVLSAGHEWLRCVGLTYPLLPTEPVPGWPTMSDALQGLGGTPVVLTLVEHEIPQFVAGQQALVRARPAGLRLIEVPGAQHGFDAGAASGEGRAAVLEALEAVVDHLVDEDRVREGRPVVAEGLEPPTSSV